MPLRPALLALALAMLAACAAPQRAGMVAAAPDGEPHDPGIVPLTLEQERQLKE